MKKVVITGANGAVGQVLQKYLKGKYEIIGLDLPTGDITNYESFKASTVGADALIHLALDPNVGFLNDLMNPTDMLMAYNVYKVCLENKIPRVIMFSSIHADDYTDWRPGMETKKVDTIPSPDSPYGALKVYVEALGRYYAKKGLEVICIRLGGVNVENDPNKEEENYRSVYLNNEDLADLIQKCIDNPKIENNYELLYAVSNNKPQIHNFTNNLGWVPKNGTENE
jgi:uronate dehydrogenase